MATKFGNTEANSMETGDQGGVKELSENVENVSEPLDAAAEKRLVRKIDFRLIPILFTLYLCAFIDRYVLI